MINTEGLEKLASERMKDKEQAETHGMTEAEAARDNAQAKTPERNDADNFKSEYNAYLAEHGMTEAEIDKMAKYYQVQDAAIKRATELDQGDNDFIRVKGQEAYYEEKEPYAHSYNLPTDVRAAVEAQAVQNRNEAQEKAMRQVEEKKNSITHLSSADTYKEKPDYSKSTMEVDIADHGKQLKTHEKSQLGGTELARVADEKGWKNVYIEGSEEFKSSAWREATSRGMTVEGYRPNEKDVTISRDEASRKGMEITDAAKMAETQGVKSGYGAPEMKESEKARALQTMPISEVKTKYPELVNECAAIKATEAKLNSTIPDPDVREKMLADFKAGVATSMDRGQKIPDISIAQVQQVRKVERERTVEKTVEHSL